jgi:hypothetical protein
MYRGRVLPFDEWARTEATELGDTWKRLDPRSTTIMVVERPDGQIVQTWMLMTVAHAEGWWTHPDYRKNPAVMRGLWKVMREEAKARGLGGVMTAATSPEVDQTLLHHGAVLLDCNHYTLRLDHRERNKRDLARGRNFHDRLLAVVPDSAHHDDPKHLRAIGAALHTAFQGGEPTLAVDTYNATALHDGYQPVTLIDVTADGHLVLEMGNVLVEVGADDSCELVAEVLT